MTGVWHFFGVLCMANAPTDCATVILNTPIEGVIPPAFHEAAKCAAQMDRIDRYTRLVPKVMGSEWIEFGCVRK